MEALAEDFDSEAARAKEQNGRPFRLGVVRPDCDPAIQEGVDSALRARSLPMTEVVLPGMEQAFDAGLTIINVETAAAFGHLVRSGLLQSDVHARLCAAKATQLDAIAHAESVRVLFTREVDAALEEVDALILPTMPVLPITLAQAKVGASVIGVSALIRPFNLSGHPALSLPIPLPGLAIKGGSQIVTRHGHDETACAIARIIESSLQRL